MKAMCFDGTKYFGLKQKIRCRQDVSEAYTARLPCQKFPELFCGDIVGHVTEKQFDLTSFMINNKMGCAIPLSKVQS